MKHLPVYLAALVLAIAGVLVGIGGRWTPLGKASRALDEADKTMMAAMNGLAYTGDPDMDFVLMMIPHHQGAVDMARAELKWGKDPSVLDLARRIEAAQQPQIDQMNRWRAAHTASPEGPDAPYRQALAAANNKMAMGMGHGGGHHHSAGTVDKHFVQMMLPHHQGAVDMGKAEIDFGADAEIIALAQAIDTAQRAEIAEMDAWLRAKAP